MLFSSIFFLCIFLPVTLILYYVLPWKFKNFLLLLVSLIFYAWGEPVYVLLMMFSIVFNYFAGIMIGDMKKMRLAGRCKFTFIFTVAVNIAILGFFKYFSWLFGDVLQISSVKSIALPIGISFYTFQILSYVIDVYWGNVNVQMNIIDFGAYITMFPQLIAGPIVRYEDIERQLKRRTLSFNKFADGAMWFIKGLAKKVLLANNIGAMFDTVMAIDASERAVFTTWLAMLAYTFQIYFDFSGYSDMAIGLGKMLGFEFVQNFDHPYLSTSATEFWRRWHISLGTWFREYVYIPLGGNRCSKAKHVRNILIVWLLTGLWHGAAWNFVLWGLYYGLLLLVEKYWLSKILDRLPGFFRHLYGMVVITFGWCLFCAADMDQLAATICSGVGALGNAFIDSGSFYYLTTNLILIIVCVLCSTPLVKNVFERICRWKKWGTAAGTVIFCLLFIMSVAYLVNATYNPFLYFRF